MVEKDRDSDREIGQGQPEVRGTSHLEKFQARAPDGHHRDYILLLCDGLARNSTFVYFLFSFFFFSDSRIVSHSLTSSKIGSRTMNLSLLVSQAIKVGLRTYESHAALRSCTPPHICVMSIVCVSWARTIRQKKNFCFLFF